MFKINNLNEIAKEPANTNRMIRLQGTTNVGSFMCMLKSGMIPPRIPPHLKLDPKINFLHNFKYTLDPYGSRNYNDKEILEIYMKIS